MLRWRHLRCCCRCTSNTTAAACVVKMNRIEHDLLLHHHVPPAGCRNGCTVHSIRPDPIVCRQHQHLRSHSLASRGTLYPILEHRSIHICIKSCTCLVAEMLAYIHTPCFGVPAFIMLSTHADCQLVNCCTCYNTATRWEMNTLCALYGKLSWAP
jgi:hypothetical protein